MLRAIVIAAAISLCFSSANAAVLPAWFEFATKQIGNDAKTTLDLIANQGLILSRIRNNYVAFSFGPITMLSAEQRISNPIDVSDLNLVVEFEMCNSSESLLSGLIYKARVRTKPSDVLKFADEIIRTKHAMYLWEKIGKFEREVVLTDKMESLERLVTSETDSDKIEIEITLKISTKDHHIEMEITNNFVCA